MEKVIWKQAQVCLTLGSSNNIKYKSVERLSQFFRAKSERSHPVCHQHVTNTRNGTDAFPTSSLLLPGHSQRAVSASENSRSYSHTQSLNLGYHKLFLGILHLCYKNKPKPCRCTFIHIHGCTHQREILASSQNSPIFGFGKHAQSPIF